MHRETRELAQCHPVRIMQNRTKTKPSSYYIPSIEKDMSLGVGAGQEAQELRDRVGTGTLWRKGRSTEKVER